MNDARFPEDEYRAAVECYQKNPHLGWPAAQEAAWRERARKAARPLPEHYARELPGLSDDEDLRGSHPVPARSPARRLRDLLRGRGPTGGRPDADPFHYVRQEQHR
jgi:hypothetical protein